MADSFPSRLIDSVNGRTGKVEVQEDRHYHHVQGTPADVWTVNHNLGKFPAVTVIDSSGREIECEVEQVNMNTVTLYFNGSLSGEASFN